MTKTSSRTPELDGLRGLAILLVVVWHYVGSDTANIPVARSLALSWSGVDCFFVLSGFLIGGILLDHRHSDRYFRAFYARRTLRILPVYYVSVALCFALPVVLHSPLLRPLLHPTLPLSSYLTLTQNYAMTSHQMFGGVWLSMTWSLAIEEQFYLVLPLLIWLLPRRCLPIALIGAMIAAPVLRFRAAPFDFAHFVQMPYHADGLMLGVLIAWVVRDERWRRRLLRVRPGVQTVSVLLAATLIVLCVLVNPSQVRLPWLATVLALFYGSLLVLAVTRSGGVARFLRLQWLRKLGLLAYGIYLLHEPVSWLTHYVVLSDTPQANSAASILVTTLSAALTLGIAAFSWRFLEKPLMALGQRVSYDRALPVIATLDPPTTVPVDEAEHSTTPEFATTSS